MIYWIIGLVWMCIGEMVTFWALGQKSKKFIWPVEALIWLFMIPIFPIVVIIGAMGDFGDTIIGKIIITTLTAPGLLFITAMEKWGGW
jgi:hypothetical protein